MAFIIEDDTVISFAEFSDVRDQDQRVFDNNEGLTDEVVERGLIRATERILTELRSSSWWRSYYTRRSPDAEINTVADIPKLDPNKIQSRQADFTDLCVAWALSEYILPQVANFGDDDDDDRAKMSYYHSRYERLFGELITAGDWYDFDNDDEITSEEKQPGYYNLRRYR